MAYFNYWDVCINKNKVIENYFLPGFVIFLGNSFRNGQAWRPLPLDVTVIRPFPEIQILFLTFPRLPGLRKKFFRAVLILSNLLFACLVEGY